MDASPRSSRGISLFDFVDFLLSFGSVILWNEKFCLIDVVIFVFTCNISQNRAECIFGSLNAAKPLRLP